MLYAVATLSALAALIHLWVAPEHFGEGWGYGAFFLVAACAQLAPLCAALAPQAHPGRLALGDDRQLGDRVDVVGYAGGGDTALRARGLGGGEGGADRRVRDG